MRFAAPKGTKDVLPAQSETWDKLERLFLRLAGAYGYREVRTPVFERTELFARGIGDATDIVRKEMFTFTDRGGRSLTLRPELTAGVVRAYLEHNLAGDGPLCKLSYLGPIFRQERPQAGRYQQFTQFGVECFGSHDPALDAEVIDLALVYLAEAGLTRVRLLLNSIGCPTCRPAYREALLEAAGQRREELCSTCRERLARNPLRVLDCKSPDCQRILAAVPTANEHLCSACAEHFAAVRRCLELLGLEYQLAPRLVRGLDYYTNTVFEVAAAGLGAQDAVPGGGRYDGLAETCGGPPTPGVGFAGGLERLILALASADSPPVPSVRGGVFLVTLGERAKEGAVRLAHDIRGAGLTTDLDYLDRSLKAQLREADRQGARAAVILGDDELSRGMAGVKWLDGKGQTEVTLTDLAAYLRREIVSEQGW